MIAHSPLGYPERLDALLRLSKLGPWVARQQPHPYFPTREQLHAHVANTVVGQQPITYLEFGVYQGASLNGWMRLNTHADSEFIGFDSFEGLPEAWVTVGRTFPRGTFDLQGQLPAVHDSRGRLIKGWFQQTLPTFMQQFESRKPLVIHCDADLYASTLFVLCTLHEHIVPGTIVIMDDFSSMQHDFRALEDYTKSFGREYQVLGAAGPIYYEHVALRCTK